MSTNICIIFQFNHQGPDVNHYSNSMDTTRKFKLAFLRESKSYDAPHNAMYDAKLKAMKSERVKVSHRRGNTDKQNQIRVAEQKDKLPLSVNKGQATRVDRLQTAKPGKANENQGQPNTQRKIGIAKGNTKGQIDSNKTGELKTGAKSKHQSIQTDKEKDHDDAGKVNQGEIPGANKSEDQKAYKSQKHPKPLPQKHSVHKRTTPATGESEKTQCVSLI